MFTLRYTLLALGYDAHHGYRKGRKREESYVEVFIGSEWILQPPEDYRVDVCGRRLRRRGTGSRRDAGTTESKRADLAKG
jgi:hypothetical protein